MQGEPQREEAGKGPGEGGGSLTVETSNACILQLLGSREVISSNLPPQIGIPVPTLCECLPSLALVFPEKPALLTGKPFLLLDTRRYQKALLLLMRQRCLVVISTLGPGAICGTPKSDMGPLLFYDMTQKLEHLLSL